MKLKLAPVLVPGLVAAIAAAAIHVSTWNSIKTSLITALSVAAAAGLVRLSRGLPFSSAAHFELDEIEKITKAVVQLARSLRAFLAITIFSMGILISVEPLIEIASAVRATDFVWWCGRLLSGVIGGFLAYVVIRLFQIVGSDLSLLKEQSKIMIRAVQREAAKQQQNRITPAMTADFRTSENYGQRIQ